MCVPLSLTSQVCDKNGLCIHGTMAVSVLSPDKKGLSAYLVVTVDYKNYIVTIVCWWTLPLLYVG